MNTTDNIVTFTALYDRTAPLVYGQIMKEIPCVEIAGDLLQQVFERCIERQRHHQQFLLSPLTLMLNDARSKSQHTLKALQLFNGCCDGVTQLKK